MGNLQFKFKYLIFAGKFGNSRLTSRSGMQIIWSGITQFKWIQNQLPLHQFESSYPVSPQDPLESACLTLTYCLEKPQKCLCRCFYVKVYQAIPATKSLTTREGGQIVASNEGNNVLGEPY